MTIDSLCFLIAGVVAILVMVAMLVAMLVDDIRRGRKEAARRPPPAKGFYGTIPPRPMPAPRPPAVSTMPYGAPPRVADMRVDPRILEMVKTQQMLTSQQVVQRGRYKTSHSSDVDPMVPFWIGSTIIAAELAATSFSPTPSPPCDSGPSIDFGSGGNSW